MPTFQRIFAALRARLPVPVLLGLVMLALFTVTRIVLLAMSGIGNVPPANWPRAFALGFVFDLAVIGAMLGPVLLYEALLPARWRASHWHRALRMTWFAFSVAVMLFALVAEITFWEEFSTRFNFIAVDYLLYTHEVIGNIRQSYPLPAIFSGLFAVAALITWLCRKALRRADEVPPSSRQRWLMAALAFALPATSIALTNVDAMLGSGNSYADELSGNGLATLTAAMRRNELDYDTFYATMPQAQADATLAALGMPRKPLQQGRMTASELRPATDPLPLKKRPRNIVMVSIESLSADYLGSYGSQDGLTPNLDRLAAEGLKFEKFYATGTRTVRGLEALSLGTPPVPGQAIVRRPNNANLSTVGEMLRPRGFDTAFVYGGYGYFDNMNAYFAANDYEVIDRTDFPDASVGFENVWGVADEYLYDNAIAQIDRMTARGKPFFVQVMTTSNHRPYTYPDGRIDIPSPGGRKGAVKYTDYAIGKFVRDASRKPWFNDTLFVFVADHCASVAGKTSLPVPKYHIPMIFYAPALISPGVHAELASQIDLPPTLLELLGVPGNNVFFGQSLFKPDRREHRAFISNYQDLGYYKDDILTVLQPKQRVHAFRIDPATGDATPTAVVPRLRDEAIAYYQTASRAFRDGLLLAPNGTR